MWTDVLGRAGITVETVDAHHVRLADGATSAVFRLRRAGSVVPSRVPAAPHGPGLFAVPRASIKAVDTLVAAGWNVVTDTGRVAVRLDKRWITPGPQPVVVSQRATQRGPTPWALFTVLRRLLAAPCATQADLARRSGVSQPKVSRVLTRLRADGLVVRDAQTWTIADWDAAADWWLARYPGPGGVTSYWTSTDPPTVEAAKAMAALTATGPSNAVLSGDVAADVLAPWRRPSSSVVYARAGKPLPGMVPVSTPDEATLTVCAPADPGLWLPSPWQVSTHQLADPLQVLHDLAPGTDQTDAAVRLRHALRTTHLHRWQEATRRL
ncbi:MAG: MarR family transcriptional regulator [Micrococcales bacterium]|nr:MarR family transcriptional regulator [Micrococcales bacterium]MCL2668633.1 MarR family transcriptional regulator [Micrococcales bacterium]